MINFFLFLLISKRERENDKLAMVSEVMAFSQFL
jgi:hypothetical protein